MRPTVPGNNWELTLSFFTHVNLKFSSVWNDELNIKWTVWSFSSLSNHLKNFRAQVSINPVTHIHTLVEEQIGVQLLKDTSTCRLLGPGIEPLTLQLVDDTR